MHIYTPTHNARIIVWHSWEACDSVTVTPPSLYSSFPTPTTPTTSSSLLLLTVFSLNYSVCSNGAVRLVNQSSLFNDGLNSIGGIVQVCINQQYGYVCADGWDNREAEVVCRSQGYRAPYYGVHTKDQSYLHVNWLFIFFLIFRKYSINNFHGV